MVATRTDAEKLEMIQAVIEAVLPDGERSSPERALEAMGCLSVVMARIMAALDGRGDDDALAETLAEAAIGGMHRAHRRYGPRGGPS